MKIESIDPKAGMSLQELKTVVDRMVAMVEAGQEDPADHKVKAWVNIKAGIKSLELA